MSVLIKGVDGNYTVAEDALPVRATVMLDPQQTQCGAITLGNEAHPCKFTGDLTRKLTCK